MGTKFLSISVESKTDFSITGSITFSSNCPAWAANATVESFPIILKQIIFMHSARDGFTLPGIIEEPACTAGMLISDKPATGPDAINLMSFEILPISTAKFLSVDDRFATANLLCNEYCMSCCGFNGNLETFASSAMTILL